MEASVSQRDKVILEQKFVLFFMSVKTKILNYKILNIMLTDTIKLRKSSPPIHSSLMDAVSVTIVQSTSWNLRTHALVLMNK